MQKIYFFVLGILFFSGCTEKIDSESSTQNINENWKFIQSDVAEAINVNFDDSDWENVNLPHDWSISKPFSKDNPSFSRGAWLPAGISYYRRELDLSKVTENQKVFIHFEGAYRNAEVWFNSEYLGKRPSGYAAFEYELTSYISDNKNIITVKLDNTEQPGSRWYSGNGIYRDVFLKIKNPVYIPTWGTYIITPEVNRKKAKVAIETTIENSFDSEISAKYRIQLISPEGISVTDKTFDIRLKTDSNTIKHSLKVENPKLWSTVTPNLYTVNTEIIVDDKISDSNTVKTGFRTMEYSSEEGFLLNGNPIKIKGVCLHHDAGPLGAAARKTSYKRQLRILKEMGTNAVRTAHNPFDPEFLDTCDEMGMLVMNEAFDEWEIVKEPKTFRENGEGIRIPVKYYAHLFKEWSDQDLTDFILRDRNHPSIFMWSIGNEIDQMHEESGVAIAKRLQEIVHNYDYRPATCGVNGYGWDKWPHEPAVSQIDVPGYNYADAEDYSQEHRNFPDRKMIVTEHSSAQMMTNRGEYYPFKKQPQALQVDLPIEHNDTQKFMNNREFYTRGMRAWVAVKNRRYVMGEFIWTGWDYLGEVIPYAWPARSSTFGVVDLAGFPKDGYYYYQSQWTKKPMIHVFPHWNWKGHEGEKLTLNAFSNTEEVELFINGKSQGKKKNDPNAIVPLSWEVIYKPGELKAVGYQNGKQIVEKQIVTAGKASKIKMEATDKGEIIYVEVAVLDEEGSVVPTANNLINFEVINGKVIGVANGNNRSHEPFLASYRKAYHGKCLVIIEKNNSGDQVILKATSENLKESKLSF